MKKINIIGGGAAGFFAAINIAETQPDYKITIYEKSNKLLSKVKVSGGGRCNVSHACFVPKDLVKFYPRGNKELIGPFHGFMTGDTMEWFENRGVPLKIEDDNRIFPQSDSSQSIIDCFMDQVDNFGIDIVRNKAIADFEVLDDGTIDCQFADGYQEKCDALILATGSAKSTWEILENKGVGIIPPVPSLFTFKIKDARLEGLMGLAFDQVEVKVLGTKHKELGPLLITHWGLSGPAVLKTSSRAAVALAEKEYQFDIQVNFLLEKREAVLAELNEIKNQHPKKKVKNQFTVDIPQRYKQSLLHYLGVFEKNWADCSKKDLEKMAIELTEAKFSINGKTTFKEEFVTAGGIDLKEIDFKHFNFKKMPNVYGIGEVLNIDALTGGFNFQAAWTGAFHAAQSVLKG